jgi:outer membrane protein OmpA-like peptidoglycan-associated protein
MELPTFLLLDTLFLVGLTWALWKGIGHRHPTRQSVAVPPLTEAPAAAPIPVRRVLFDGNSARLSRQAVAELDALAVWIFTTNLAVELVGSADDTGHLTQNRKLARQRAGVAQRALLAHGVSASRLMIRSREPSRGATERERQALRCVEVAPCS